MRTILPLIVLLLASGPLPAQKVYQVIQPDGTVEFTDAPPPGEAAKVIEVPPLNSADPVAPPPSAAPAPDAAPQGYSEFRIVSPGNGEAIRDNAGNVSVDLNLTPALRSGDVIDVTVDGRSVGGGRATAISLSDLDRGSHRMQAVVKNAAGQVVARSNSVNFTLQRRSAILQPATPRPTPFGGGRAS